MKLFLTLALTILILPVAHAELRPVPKAGNPTGSYWLYRTRALGGYSDYMASFDASDQHPFNRTNCQYVADLLNKAQREFIAEIEGISPDEVRQKDTDTFWCVPELKPN